MELDLRELVLTEALSKPVEEKSDFDNEPKEVVKNKFNEKEKASKVRKKEKLKSKQLTTFDFSFYRKKKRKIVIDDTFSNATRASPEN